MGRFREVSADETDRADEVMATDINHGRGSQIATQDWRTGHHQRLPAPNASVMTPGQESGDASELSRLLLLVPILISRPDSTARTTTHA